MVCLDTPTSRATSSTARPASTCFKALIISASLCLPLDMVLPLSFDEIIFNFVRNQGSRSVTHALSGQRANAIADFKWYVDWAPIVELNDVLKNKRVRWIKELEA